jgi:hypothetical protein
VRVAVVVLLDVAGCALSSSSSPPHEMNTTDTAPTRTSAYERRNRFLGMPAP